MIWQSVPLMTAIDLLVVAAAFAATIIYFRNRRRVVADNKALGFTLSVLGLVLIAIFYLADLAVMHILPSLTTETYARAAMEDMHLNYAWFVVIGGVALISVGGAITGKNLLGLVDRVSASEQSLSEELDQRHQTETLNARLGKIVEDSINEIYVFDSQSFKFEMVNRGARENLGYSMEELSYLTPVDLKPEFTNETFRDLLQPLADGDQDQLTFSTSHQRKDGSLYDVDVRLHLSRTDGHPIYFAIIEDMNERNISEKRLQNAQKMEVIGQLAGGIAHDFNNLLAVVLGNAEMTKEKLSDDEPVQALLDLVVQAGMRGADLTQRLLAFSRQQVLAPAVVNLNEILVGITELLSRTLGEHIEIESKLADDIWRCEVDRSQVENALLNLALNARDAMPEGGTLSIETQNAGLDDEYAAAQLDVTPGEYVMLAVTDTGQGIAQEDMEHLFEPFFSTKEVGAGTGLGLSMIYGFVKQSGGHVSVYSEVDVGTTFKIYLPRTLEKLDAEAVEATSKIETRAREETIFVVEDDPDVRTLVVALLGDLGYRVLEAQTGPSALALLTEGQHLDLLLTDVVLPDGMTGPDLAAVVRDKFPGIKVLFMSGYAEHAMKNGNRLGGLEHFIQKPFGKKDLANKLRQVLEASD